MLLSDRISIHRVIAGTWRHLVFNIITCILTYSGYHYLLKGNVEIPVLIPTVIGTALAFFIGFNNNQAYDRWWEARKIWGALVNSSRTWARQIIYFTSNDKERQSIAKKMVLRHISFVYALKQKLRKSSQDEYRKYLSELDLETVTGESNLANAMLSLQTRDLMQLYTSNAIDGFRFTELNKVLTSFCDEMGKSERISNTVFPTTYNYYTRIFIWFFIILITLTTAQSMGLWSILLGVFIGYIYLTIHKIGQSLLNPFDNIPTGIPLNQIARTIEINLLEMLKEKEVPKPIESSDGEFIL